MTEADSLALARQNPPAAGFNAAGSDERAIELADDVMLAMGGRKAWDQTRYLAWNFFGSREWLWDKWTGDVRVDFLRRDLKIRMNVNRQEGQVMKDGVLLDHPDSLQKYLKLGTSVWINDSYWLVMPFKLKDSGVTLKYLRQDTTLARQQADVIQLTFEAVGDTPQNKYEVWIDQSSKLVAQWAYFSNNTDTLARFTLPWGNYQKHGNILLSDDRGERDLSNVRVVGTVPQNAFTSFDAIEY
jgi:plasmid maintenance system killer protein